MVLRGRGFEKTLEITQMSEYQYTESIIWYNMSHVTARFLRWRSDELQELLEPKRAQASYEVVLLHL